MGPLLNWAKFFRTFWGRIKRGPLYGILTSIVMSFCLVILAFNCVKINIMKNMQYLLELFS